MPSRRILLLALGVSAWVLSACSSDYTVPSYAKQDEQSAPKADANGWYHFRGLDFRGQLKNGAPDGPGFCRTDYLEIDFIGDDGLLYTETRHTEDPCQFNAGERIDELHQLRMKRVSEVVSLQNKASAKASAQEAAQRAARDREASRATERALQEGLQNFRKGLSNAAQEDAQRMAIVQQTADAAMVQRRQQEEFKHSEAAARQRVAEANARMPSKPTAGLPGTRSDTPQKTAPPTPTKTQGVAATSNAARPPDTAVATNGGAKEQTSHAVKNDVDKPKARPMEWGPVQQEAMAVCHQSEKTGKWACNGPLDNQILVDIPTLESALARQSCAGGTWAAGGPVINGVQYQAYRCGHALGAGDYDVHRRYGLITARRQYMCPKYMPGDGRCDQPYTGQDRRSN